MAIRKRKLTKDEEDIKFLKSLNTGLKLDSDVMLRMMEGDTVIFFRECPASKAARAVNEYILKRSVKEHRIV